MTGDLIFVLYCGKLKLDSKPVSMRQMLHFSFMKNYNQMDHNKLSILKINAKNS